MSSTDVAVIGAGPGGLAAAHTLGDAGLRVVLIEAGRSHLHRPCPVDRMLQCTGCAGVCNVISGFGGSIHYGDGVKLSGFPSGRRLQELLGGKHARELERRALEILFDRQAPTFRGVDRLALPAPTKDYPVASLTATEVQALVGRAYERVSSSAFTSLRLGTEVADIRSGSRARFALECTTHGGEREYVEADHVVAAVGRRGQRWWQRQVRALGVRYTAPTPSVGVRFECPAAMLRRGALVHEDFKTTLVSHGVKVKTFCFCAGPGGGRVKFTDYGDHTLLDGHVIAEERAEASGNFALLAQLRDGAGVSRDTAWVEENLLAPYRRLRPERPGKPVAQWYPDFRARALECRSLPEMAQRTGFAPSLRDYGVANLAEILPVEIHAAMIEGFESLLASFTGTGFTEDDARQVVVLGLELESLWDELVLSERMETSLDGLFAVGDCTGLAQGIMQAAVGGLAAAQRILERNRAGAR